MKQLKVTYFIMVFLIIISLTLTGAPLFQNQNQEKKVTEKTQVREVQKKSDQTEANKKEPKKSKREAEKSNDDLGTTIKQRMDEGESLFNVIGVPEWKEFMPSTGVMIVLILIPLAGLVGIILLILMLVKNRHKKIVAMVDKGIYKPELVKINWGLAPLLIGIILSLGGLGLSVYTMARNGAENWYNGIIPFFLGIAFIIFHLIINRKK